MGKGGLLSISNQPKKSTKTSRQEMVLCTNSSVWSCLIHSITCNVISSNVYSSFLCAQLWLQFSQCAQLWLQFSQCAQLWLQFSQRAQLRLLNDFICVLKSFII